ncbi:MAG: hypothetical protein IJW37_05530 [Lachnospiraceae bacterium]|nr:hypothetical protein [Lachnospiraceae bacterium]
MKVLYGTTNQAKLASMQRITESLGMELISLKDITQPIPVIDENGKSLLENATIKAKAYYGGLAREHGGRLTGRYRNAICFIVDETMMFTRMDDSIATDSFVLIEKPHAKRNPGFPLDSLSIDPETGKYYYDLEDTSVDASAVDVGLKQFFEETMKELRRK